MTILLYRIGSDSGTYLFIMLVPVLLLSALPTALGCQIAGQEIGKCVSHSQFQDDSFCGNWVQETVCVPVESVVWPYSTVTYRDNKVQDIFIFYVEYRLLEEYIYQNSAKVLSNNQACYEAYKRWLCEFNFPKCDQEGQTQPVCYSVCQQFFQDCESSSDACDIIYLNRFPGLDVSC